MQDGIHTEQTETHCPYCALQCGMSSGSGARSLDRRRARFPDQQGRAVPQGLDGGGAALCPGSADDAADARRARARRCARRPGTRRSTASSTACARPGVARPRCGRRVWRRRADQREGLHAGQVRARRAADRAISTTTAASAWRQRRPPTCGASASIAACRSRSQDIAAARTRSCWPAAIRPRPCRRSCNISTSSAAAAAG